jgi:thymidylate synthase (FAD)
LFNVEDAQVKLLHYTPLDVALEAALVCTSSDDQLENYKGKRDEFLLNLLGQGHESVFEHIVYTFRIENITRALLQELARHRHISLSVKSTRYTLRKEALKNKFALNFKTPIFMAYFSKQQEAYKQLLNALDEMEKTIINAINVGIKNDVVKYFVPEALTTKLIMTVNLRELRHILMLRTGHNVLAEFRWLCFELYKALPEDHKFLFSDIAKIFDSKDFGN